ncbi:Asp-tRNA(Asn)/Glu-tRNA(Gln) amidotransferase subunit GatB [Halorutilales archaeon Cl-col2-1]
MSAKPGESLDVTIGLEIHVQLDTQTKMFCGCSTDYENAEPNTHTCPVCLGLPGSLPVVNQKAVEYAVMVGKALDCEIADETRFHRKNYFYPDLPKNFQITQYDAPINQDGSVDLRVGDDEKEVRIRRAHMEEDPGSLVHKGGSIESASHTLVDYNRSGTPLMEIVTEPDLETPEEARGFVDKLREILEYLDVFDTEEGGTIRVDANVSIEVDGEGGNRTEIKNIGSTKGVEKALAYEITRQKNQIKRGAEIRQETRHYDDDRGITVTLREKAEEHDYRYFEEADIPVVRVEEFKGEIGIPELPDARRERFIDEYDVSDEVAEKLTSKKAVADFYETVAEEVSYDVASTWVADELLGELNYRDMTVDEVDVSEFVGLVEMVDEDEITDRNAVEALRDALDEGRDPVEIVEERDMKKAGEDVTVEAVEEAIDDNPDAVDDYVSGEDDALNFLVGQVMQKTGGSADPGTVNETLREKLDSIAEAE